VVDESVRAAFESDGAVAVRGLLDAEWIQSLRVAMPEILERAYDPAERMTGTGGKRVRQCDGIWRDCHAFARFLFNSPVGELASELMRSSTARLYEELLLYKEPGADGSAGWHRDSPLWPLAGNQLSSVWFTLESVTSDTGAMRFVAGSHVDTEVDPASVGITPAEAEQKRVITIEAEPGDVVVFHPRVIHTAYGSAPDRPRRTFTLRFMGDDIRWRPRRSFFHPWMSDCGLQKGDVVDHPWFPVVRRSEALV
jgi:ectoine hydroxylase-related dioxygenase (phytanoyl-CoA dioxygenase family)